MSLVIAICGAFVLGGWIGSVSLYLFYRYVVMNSKGGLHAYLHGIAHGDPGSYIGACPACRLDLKHLPPVVGCIHCQLEQAGPQVAK